jgi:transcriptional antiterminator NusG
MSRVADQPKESPAMDSATTDATAAAAGQKLAMKWYVVQVYSGFEQKVKLSLAERIKQVGMDGSFGEVLIPTETVQDNQGAKRVSSKTFYPGYIFVQMAMSDEAWHVVRDTPKVTGFVGGRKPQPVPSPEIQSVVQQVEEGAAKPRPRVLFSAGDHVRVNDGAFANFTGTIEEVKPEKQKVRVLVSIFGRATPVELDYSQVEKTA